MEKCQAEPSQCFLTAPPAVPQMYYSDLHHGKTASEAGYDCLMRFFMWKYSILRMMITEAVRLTVLCLYPFFGEDRLVISPMLKHRVDRMLKAVLFENVGGRPA